MTSPPRRHLIAFIQSSWHEDIVNQARVGFLEVVTDEHADVETFEVPGAFELPLHARHAAQTGAFDAVAVAGFVVDGGIYRHEFVAHAVIDGLMRVQLELGVPVFSGVLTPQQFHEHDTHRNFFQKHMLEKGRELGRSCLATMDARALVSSR